VSDEFVVDASAAVRALTGKDAVGRALSELLAAATCHAPHLIDAEVGHVLRRLERIGHVSEESASTAVRALSTVIDQRYQHAGWLAIEAWELRHAFSFYDGLYVGLATRLGMPLLTGDVKLSKAPNLPCRVELIG
jgi:predicted nucleic acid-binding protein